MKLVEAMSIRAVFFDFGGVIQRTEYHSPRQRLAERFGMDYDDMERLIFAGESARLASLGRITEEAHWYEVLKRLKCSPSELSAIKDEFFGGDILDRTLLDFIRSLRGRVRTGLITNAWSEMRAFLQKQGLLAFFDDVIISAEVGVAKPQPGIYHIALERAGVEAGEAVFVDDVQANVDACRQVGMKGILFDDPQEAMRRLKQLLGIQ